MASALFSVHKLGVAIAGVTATLAVWIVLATVFCGIGLAAMAPIRRAVADAEELFFSFWVGLSAFLAIAIVWHLAFAIGPALQTLAAVLSLYGWWHHHRRWGWPLADLPARGGASQWHRSRTGAWFLVTFALLGWIANISTAPLNSFDSGAYHLPAVLWALRFPAVPGLVNLHGPLGFNNAHILYDAALSFTPDARYSSHWANSLLIAVSVTQGIWATAQVWSPGEFLRRPTWAYETLLPIPALSMCLFRAWGDSGVRVSTFSNDVPVVVLVLTATAWVLRFALDDFRSDAQRTLALYGTPLIMSAAVAAKMSCSIQIVCLWLLTVVVLVRRHAFRFTALLPLIIIPAAVAIPHLARGIVLSGYPLFPSRIGGIAVDWRAHELHAAGEFLLIKHSGRESGSALLAGLDMDLLHVWLPLWFEFSARYHVFELWVPLAISAVSLCGYAVALRRLTTPTPYESCACLAIALTAFVALVAWATTAPAPRYASGMTWTLAAGVLMAWATLSNRGRIHGNVGRKIARGSLVLTVSVFVLMPLTGCWNARDWSFAQIKKALIQGPPEEGIYWNNSAAPEVSPYVTDSGLQLNYVWRRGGRCLRTELPCTPNPAANLEMRRPGELASGFRANGAWAMEQWPYEWLSHYGKWVQEQLGMPIPRPSTATDDNALPPTSVTALPSQARVK